MYQKRKGAQPLVHREYTKRASGGGGGEKKERKSSNLITRGASQPAVQVKRVKEKNGGAPH
jgi:hypothetical protein